MCGRKRLLRKTDTAVGDGRPHGACREHICFDCTYRPECKADTCRGAPPVRSAFPAGRFPFFGKTRRVCACDGSGLRITVYRIFSGLTVMPEMFPPPGFFFRKNHKNKLFCFAVCAGFPGDGIIGNFGSEGLERLFFF